MWALNSSTVVPANTVRPMPTMPALTSLTGITGEAADSGHNTRQASRIGANGASEQHLGHIPSAGPAPALPDKLDVWARWLAGEAMGDYSNG